jgi:hypothetical protein
MRAGGARTDAVRRRWRPTAGVVSIALLAMTAIAACGSGGNGNGGGNGGGNGDGSPAPSVVPTPAATPTATAPPSVFDYYQVKQTQHLGDEVVSGGACLPSAGGAAQQRLAVRMTTQTITFLIGFQPTTTSAGSFTYAYSFPDLGESHSATGTYTLSGPAADGMRTVRLTGRDHVVFNGFDGPIPVTYAFGLVPVQPSCP